MSNSKHSPFITVNDLIYERIPVKTHLINFGEDLFSIIQTYIGKQFKNGDWIAISEKVVSVCQKNARHISTVKVGWLAKIIAQSSGVALDKKTVRLILLDNPMGQNDEMTPFIIVRQKKH